MRVSFEIEPIDKRQIQSAAMKFVRAVREACIRNEQIREELRVFAVYDKIKDYKQCLRENVDRMEDRDLL